MNMGKPKCMISRLQLDRLQKTGKHPCMVCRDVQVLPDGMLVKVTVVGIKIEVVSEFCYLGDMLFSGGDCELASTVRCRTAWGKFRELIPILINKHHPLVSRGRVYSTCVRSVMLHGS